MPKGYIVKWMNILSKGFSSESKEVDTKEEAVKIANREFDLGNKTISITDSEGQHYTIDGKEF